MPVEPIDLDAKRKIRPRPPTGEAPPRNVRDAAQDAAPDEPKRSPKDRKLAANLAQFYGLIGVGLSGVGQATNNMALAVAGVNIAARGEATAETWLDVAERSIAVRRALEGFTEGSAWAGLIGAHAVMVAPILASVRQDVPPPVAGMIWNGCLTEEAKLAAVAFGLTAEPPTPNGAEAA